MPSLNALLLETAATPVSTAPNASSSTAITPTIDNGSIGDVLIWIITWGVPYTGSAYFTSADRPTLSGGVSGAAIHLGTGIGGPDDPTEVMGVGTGKRGQSWWKARATSATGATDAVTFTNTASGVLGGTCIRIPAGSGWTDDVAVVFGPDNVRADAWAPSFSGDPGGKLDDVILPAFTGNSQNPNIGVTWTSWPGVTVSAFVSLISGAIGGTQQARQNTRYSKVTSGTSSGTPVVGSTTRDATGVQGLGRVRLTAPAYKLESGSGDISKE